MSKLILIAFALSGLLLGAVNEQPIATVQYSDIMIREDVTLVRIPIELSSAPDGLSGYSIAIYAPDGALAAVTVDPAFTLSSIEVFPSYAVIHAADVTQVIGVGDSIPLAVVDYIPPGVGVTRLVIEVLRLDDDGGLSIPASGNAGAVEVRPFPTMPGFSNKVGDLNGDGMAEDLNGNGRLDFDDLVTLFTNLDSPEVLDDIDLFDWNANGRTDFDDVVTMFTWMLEAMD